MDEEVDALDHNPTLRDYLRVLRRRKWVIGITVLAAVAITLAYSLNQPKQYSASAYVQVPPPGGYDPTQPSTISNYTVDQQRRLLEDQSRYASSFEVRRRAASELGHTADYQVQTVLNSSVIQITGLSDDAKDAQRTANTVAAAYLRASNLRQNQDSEQTINEGQKALTSLGQRLRAMAPTDPRRTGLTTALNNLSQDIGNAQIQTVVRANKSGGTVLLPAFKPSTPDEPKTARNVGIAAVLGLIAGICLAFLMDRLDDSVRTKRDLELASGGLPVLGLIPSIPGWRNAKDAKLVSVQQPGAGAADAFRTLRTSIEIMGLDDPLGTIVFTSAKPAEGKSTVAANLAVALARASRRVALVCCDFRRPRTHEFFGLPNDVGFTSVLVGDTTLERALQPIPEVPNLVLLSSGPVPPNPSELLSMRQASDLLAELASTYDYVLIDAPPILPVPDALQLVSMADGVVLATMAKRSTSRELDRAVELLHQMKAPVLGTVFSGIQRSGGYSYETNGYGQSGAAGLLKRRGSNADANGYTNGSTNGHGASTNGGTAPAADPADQPTR